MSRRICSMTATAALLSLALACSKQSSPVAPGATSSGNGGDASAAADGSTLKSTAPAPQSPVNDAPQNDLPTLVASPATLKFGGTAALTYRFQVFNDANALVQDSGQQASPSFKLTATLDFKKRYTWKARAESGALVGPWSTAASFVSAEGGYIRGNEVFDPIYNGITLGERIGPTSFVPDKGIRLDSNLGYVRYTIPQTITAGEFSVEVEGLRANAPGDKSKVMAMSTNSADFITDPYRVDIQYRGTTGSPTNSITYRALFGSADDLSLRYEPDTAVRLASVFILSPTTTYTWKYTWGNGEVRVVVAEGGAKANGKVLYNVAVKATKGVYNPQPHYAYLGAPTGRSGAEAASIPQTIYRNVWIGARPRP